MRNVVVILALLLTGTAFAQKAKPIEVEVKQVNDRRTSGSFAHLMISLELPKIRSSEVAASRIFLSSAVDDSGASLLDPQAGEPQLEQNFSAGMSDGPPRPVSVNVMLKNPDRKSTMLKEVRGEIELFMPSKDTNSVADVAKFLSQSGKTISNKALKANGVEIALMSDAQIAAEKKKRADAKRKELKEAGLEGDDLENYVKSHLEYVLALQESDLLLRVKDPNKRIQQISYVTPSGEIKRVSARDEEGYVILSTWGEKPQPDWMLRVNMTTPKNLVRHSFALADVPLP